MIADGWRYDRPPAFVLSSLGHGARSVLEYIKTGDEPAAGLDRKWQRDRWMNRNQRWSDWVYRYLDSQPSPDE